MPDQKEPIPKFAARIKAKYPQYKDIDDTLLTQRIIEKYPEYRDMVDFPVSEPVKKKQTSGGGVIGSSMDGQTGLRPIETTEEQRQQAAQMYQEDKGRQINPFLKVSGGDKKLIEEGEKLQRAVRNKRETQAAQVALQEGKDLEDMAAHYRAQLDPSFKEQFENLRSTGQFQPEPFSNIVAGKPGREYKARASDIFGKSTRGNNLANFILNPNVQQLAKENPELNTQLKQEAANLLQNFPEFGEKYLGGILSQKMEDMGINNGIVNVVSKKELDQAVSKLKEEGQLTPQEEKFIAERIRPKMGLGNFWRSITGQPAVKTTGLVENALGGAIGGVQDIGKGVSEITGINSALLSDKGLLSSAIEKEHRKVSVKPVGVWHDITTLGGQAFGQSMVLGGAGKGMQGLKLIKSPAGAMALAGGVSAYGRYAPEARQKFPDSKLKQIGYTTLMSGIEAATENIFRDTKVVDGLMKEIKSPIQKVIKEFTQKNIDAAAAKAAVNNTVKSAIEKLPKAAKLFGKAVGENTLEEVAAEIGGQASGGVFEGKPVNEWFDGDQIAEAAKQGLLGSIFIGGLATRADLKKSQGVTSKQIYLMARDPEAWAEKIRESATDPADANDVKDKLENLDYAANLLKELDSDTKMSEKQKAKYVLLSLQSKANAQAQPTATDEVLRGQQQRNITESQGDFNTAKEELLTGKDDGTFEGDKTDDPNTNEEKLFEQISKAAPEGYKATLEAAKAEGNILGGIEYMKDKFAENPIKFREDFGDEITDKVLAQTPTETIMEKLDYLLETNADDPAVPVLDKILQDRESLIEGEAVPTSAPVQSKFKGYVEDTGAMPDDKPGYNQDRKMRAIATGFIGEIKRDGSISYKSADEVAKKTGANLTWDKESGNLSALNDNSKVIMLARNYEYNGKDISQETKDAIKKASDNGAEFILSDMQGVDSQFMDYLQEIGAPFTIYHTEGNPYPISKKEVSKGNSNLEVEQFAENDTDLYREMSLRIKTEGGKIGEVDIMEHKKNTGNEKGYRITAVHINKDQRGKGIGKDVYRALNQKSLKETGFPLWSTTEYRNENSEKLWKSLEKSGEAELTKEGNYRFKIVESNKPDTRESKPSDNFKEISNSFEERFGVKLNIINEQQVKELLKGDNSKDFFFKILDDVDVFDSKDPNEAKKFITDVFNTVENAEDAKKAYRKLAVKYHPDKQGSEEVMKHINEVYGKYQKGTLKGGREFTDTSNANQQQKYEEWADRMSKMYEEYTKSTPPEPKQKKPKLSKEEFKREEQKIYDKRKDAESRLEEKKREAIFRVEREREKTQQGASFQEQENIDRQYWQYMDNIEHNYYRELEKIESEFSKEINELYDSNEGDSYFQKKNGKIAGIYNHIAKEAYLVYGTADETTPIHEAFSHPLIDAIEISNKDLFNNLKNEASKDSQVVSEVDEKYKNAPQSVKEKEYIAAAIDMEAKGRLKNKKLIEYIKEFWKDVSNKIKDIFGGKRAKIENINPKTTIKELVDFLLESGQKLDLKSEGQPPISEPPKGSRIHVQRPATELSHKGLQDVANEFSLDDVKKRDRKSDIKLRQDAVNTMNDWLDKKEYPSKVEGLVKKAESGDILTDEQRVILEQHLANISQELRELPKNSPEFDSKLAEIKRLKDAGEKTRSEAGAALRIPTFRSRPKDLADYMVAEMEAAGVDKLTDQQKATAEKEFEEITKAEKAYQDKIAALQEENAKLRAEAAVKKTKGQSKKGEKKDFKAERKQIVDDIKEKLKKARGETQASVVPYLKELIAISPDVAKLMKSYVEQGITELTDLVKQIHGDLKDGIPDITETDVRDLIAGKYSEKRTQGELAAKLRDLRTEARYINEYEALEKGEEPKSEKKKVERNRKLSDLKKKISEHELSKLADYKKRVEGEIGKIEEQLKTGEFSKEEKKPLPLDKEAKELQDKLIKLKQERERRLLLEEQAKAKRWDKIKIGAANVLGVPRSLMSSIDFSAPLRQSFVATVGNPDLAVKAGGKMFQAAFSQKVYDRWFDDLAKGDRYQLMLDSKLGITNMRDPKLTAREEEYMSNLAQKIPLIGSLVKGSERAYSIYLNKMRVDVFNRLTDEMQKNGKTWENSKEQYQQLAKFVNNITGRGDLSETLEKASPLLNTLFFSPRLMASRVNTMTYLAQPRFYKTVPAEARKAYFKGLVSTAGLGLLVLGLAKAAGAETEDDPRSPDFGKIKSGNTRWDIWGGHQQYIRTVANMVDIAKKRIKGETKDSPYEKTIAGTGGTFLRYKLAPVAGVGLDLAYGETAMGDKLGTEKKWGDYTMEHLLPLNITGVAEAVKDQGAKALFTVGVPSTFGVGVQTYESKPKTFTIYGANTKRDATEKEVEQYEKIKDQLFNKKMAELKGKGVGVNKYGEITLDKDKIKTRKAYDNLTSEEKKEIERRLESSAATQAKSKFQYKK